MGNGTKIKERERLGIENITARKKVLLGKWFWRFPQEENYIWYRVIKSKYRLNENRSHEGCDLQGGRHLGWKLLNILISFFLI